MPLGLLAKKLGSTRVYNARGIVTPVTVVLAGPNRVLQVKTQAGKDGYNAVQLGFDDQKEQRLGEALFLLVVETELNGVVTVLAGLGFDLQHAIGTREHDGDRGDDAARIINARATEFFS